MKLVKHFLLLLLFVFTVSLNAQVDDCDQFLPLFEAGEYDKVVALLNECKQDENISKETINQFDFYLQLSYAFLKDYERFDAERLEELSENDVLKYDKNIFTACLILFDNYSTNQKHLKAIELTSKILFDANNFVDVKSKEYALLLMKLASSYAKVDNLQKAIDIALMALSITENISTVDYTVYYASLLNDLMSYYYDLGDYLKAIEFAKKELLIQKTISGENNHYSIASLSNLATCYFMLGEYSEAVEIQEEVLSIKKMLLGENDLNYAKSLTNLALYHLKSGSVSKAIDLQKQVSNTRRDILGEKHLDYAESLSNLASCYSGSRNFLKAIKFEEQSLCIRKELIGENHSIYATSLGDLANYNADLGRFSKAVELAQQKLSIEKIVFGENHLNYASTLSDLAAFYIDLGNYLKAIVLAKQAVSIKTNLFDEFSEDYARSLNVLAVCYSKIGDYPKAIDLGEQALYIRKELLGENHRDYANSLSILANNYARLGDYSKAMELGNKALFIRHKELGENHPSYVESLINVSSYYAYLGDYSKAIDLGDQALFLQDSLNGKFNSTYIRILNNLIAYSVLFEDYSKALELGIEVNMLENLVYDGKHPSYIISLSNLASLYHKKGSYSKAIELVHKALNIQKTFFVNAHPQKAVLLSNLASYYASLGDYSQAFELGIHALSIRKELLGKNHPDYIGSLSDLAFYCFFEDKLFQSSEYLEEVFYKKRKQLQGQFNWLTESERQLYWTHKNWWYLYLPSYGYSSRNYPAFINLSYDAVLLSKALMLSSSIELNNLLMESGDEEVIAKAEELRTIHYTLNRIYEKPISERYLDTDSLETVAQNLERDLLKSSKEYGDYTQFMSVTWQDVQKGLSEKNVAIEFVEFPVLKSNSTMYAALVLRKDWEGPQMIPLLEKREIKQYMTQSPDKQYSDYVGKQLYKLMWKPLEEVIQKGDVIHFSAAGVYHQLALEYLPSEDGTPLCDIYNFHRLSSTRQLALEEEESIIEIATLYGGIQYDVNPSEMLVESKKHQQEENLYAYRGMSVDSLRGGSWNPLDNTVKEVEFISGELINNQIETALFTGTNANEESIKALSGKKTNILHLATHGFFLPIEETRKVNYFQMIGRDDNPTSDMSMRRSGLIMAGGNRAWVGDSIPEGVDDGILTAQEISVLDFREMDLVVLSACETGLGDINTSEGVFGLQRAFKKAGAKTLIMSLWKVNDEVTKSLMNKFYESFLSGKTKHEAFLEAQQFIRARHPEPQNWAAFIMLD